MSISKYNTLRFIVDVSYEDHALKTNPDWTNWFTTVSRLYGHKMPLNLLMALKAKATNNSIITQLCDEQLEKLEQRKEKDIYKRIVQSNRYNAWIERQSNRNAQVLKENQIKP